MVKALKQFATPANTAGGGGAAAGGTGGGGVDAKAIFDLTAACAGVLSLLVGSAGEGELLVTESWETADSSAAESAAESAASDIASGALSLVLVDPDSEHEIEMARRRVEEQEERQAVEGMRARQRAELQRRERENAR
jgi:hypothetical protein